MSDGDGDLVVHATYRLTARNSDGEVLGSETIENTGGFTIEDVGRNALFAGVNEFHVEIVSVETRRDGELVQRLELANE